MVKYDHQQIEAKWQKKWLEEGIYSPGIKSAKKPFYNLWMYPYPSGEGLHAGHAFASTGSDIFGRFMRMHGKDVFQPIGYDSFGMHAENYAIKTGEHPAAMLKRTTKHYESQLKMLGHGYDWTKTVMVSDMDYYRWTQWIFVQLFKAGLAYQKEAAVNFCPSCKTVVADEQVINSKCERCESEVEKRSLKQWFFRITDYADKLLEGHKKIDWSQRVVTAQRNWIGKSEGMIINFKTDNGENLSVFTTRPDTLNAVTFIVLADENMYREEETAKEGVFTGEYALDPLSGRKLPIWKANYIAPGYGTGAVMGVPAHDERDREFAIKYHIDIFEKDPDESLWKRIEEGGWGYRKVNYHLRDWIISRQRYWGPPIPLIYCSGCAKEGKGYFSDVNRLLHKDQDNWEWQGWYPDENLPVRLPEIKNYQPEGTGKGPLANYPDFYQTACPSCGSPARRETDVSDTFLDSAWYFLRYPSVGDNKEPFDLETTRKWLPVDLYFGGAEHSVLHLMYARFITMVLHDLGHLDFSEPFPKFFAHGLMIKDGAKMSKSRGNVVNPDEYLQKFGADALRLYLMFIGPMDASPDFRDAGIEGMHRFVGRLWRLFGQNTNAKTQMLNNKEIITKLHQTIKKVSEDIQAFKYNTAISAIMVLVNHLEDMTGVTPVSVLKTLCLLIAPFAPHLAEEVWQTKFEIRNSKFESVHLQPWPKYDARFIREEEITIIIQVNGKRRAQLVVHGLRSTAKGEIEKMAEKEVAKWLEGKKIKKVIFVPGRLINFVL